jgi:hypothetical protein
MGQHMVIRFSSLLKRCLTESTLTAMFNRAITIQARMYCTEFLRAGLWIVATFALVATRLPAQRDAPPDSSRWAFVDSSLDNTSADYIDTTTVQRMGDTATVWRETRYSQPQHFGSELAADLISQDMIDCAHARVRSLAIVTYFHSGVVGSMTGPDDRWLPAPPGSKEEGEVLFACTLAGHATH